MPVRLSDVLLRMATYLRVVMIGRLGPGLNFFLEEINGALQALLQWHLRFPIQMFSCPRDIRFSLLRVSVRAPIFENDPGGVSGEMIDFLCEFHNSDFVRVAKVYR